MNHYYISIKENINYYHRKKNNRSFQSFDKRMDSHLKKARFYKHIFVSPLQFQELLKYIMFI